MMKSGIRVGKLFGIEIEIDWSWLLIFVLVTWNLSSVFGQFHEDWSTALRWGIALIASLSFFASVLAHELAHSIMARMQGMQVRSITLFLFGGVSNLQRNPPSPKAEFLITIVGPLTSFALGFILTALSTVSIASLGSEMPITGEVLGRFGPVVTVLVWLGSVNIILGVFNLIPGFPLDGGRILRSVLWAITDDLRRATRWAAGVGQFVAWAMIFAAVSMAFGAEIPFFGTGLANGLWLGFIGWFLNSASVQSYQQVVLEDVLAGVTVEKLMRKDPPTVSPAHSIDSLVHEYVMGTDDHAFPVVEEGRLVGIVTLEDIRKVARDEWPRTTVKQVMTPAAELESVSPEGEAEEALRKIRERDVRQLPVMRDGELVGLIRRRDFVRWMQLSGR